MKTAFGHFWAGCVAAACLSANVASAGVLFIGTDNEEFNAGGAGSTLVKVTVSGANFVSQQNIALNFDLNGLGDGPGFLYAGAPSSNTLNRIDYNGVLLGSVAAGFSPQCCNEEMQFQNGHLYHAHWSTNIQEIDPITGAVLQTFDRPQVVGMALVGGTMWITNWAAKQVGTWDPATNVFTSVFTTPDLAGALAYDADSDILWVGQNGGNVIPYSLTGTKLGAGFQPFGGINATIDGLTFQGEGSQTPEPLSLALVGLGLGSLALTRRRKARTT